MSGPEYSTCCATAEPCRGWIRPLPAAILMGAEGKRTPGENRGVEVVAGMIMGGGILLILMVCAAGCSVQEEGSGGAEGFSVSSEAFVQGQPVPVRSITPRRAGISTLLSSFEGRLIWESTVLIPPKFTAAGMRRHFWGLPWLP